MGGGSASDGELVKEDLTMAWPECDREILLLVVLVVVEVTGVDRRLFRMTSSECREMSFRSVGRWPASLLLLVPLPLPPLLTVWDLQLREELVDTGSPNAEMLLCFLFWVWRAASLAKSTLDFVFGIVLLALALLISLLSDDEWCMWRSGSTTRNWLNLEGDRWRISARFCWAITS